MKIVILAAGRGIRFGRRFPKPLARLWDGTTIIERQVHILKKYFDLNDVMVVVGFKKELIMNALPDLTYVYNNIYYKTKAARSMLKAIRKIKNEDLLWLNGDVVFKENVIDEVIKADKSCAVVNTLPVGSEEVKYDLDSSGFIKHISKKVEDPLGEVLGINFFKAESIELLRNSLERTEEWDHAVKGIQIAIDEGLKLSPLLIENKSCFEVDFQSDLAKMNWIFNEENLVKLA